LPIHNMAWNELFCFCRCFEILGQVEKYDSSPMMRTCENWYCVTLTSIGHYKYQGFFLCDAL
jgi:hypothetical protein